MMKKDCLGMGLLSASEIESLAKSVILVTGSSRMS